MRRLKGCCSSGWASVSLATRRWQRPHLFSYKQGPAPPPDRSQSPALNLAAVDSHAQGGEKDQPINAGGQDGEAVPAGALYPGGSCHRGSRALRPGGGCVPDSAGRKRRDSRLGTGDLGQISISLSVERGWRHCAGSHKAPPLPGPTSRDLLCPLPTPGFPPPYNSSQGGQEPPHPPLQQPWAPNSPGPKWPWQR